MLVLIMGMLACLPEPYFSMDMDLEPIPIPTPTSVPVTVDDMGTADDHGDFHEDATPVVVGVPVSGALAPAYDVDWFVFDAHARMPYVIETNLTSPLDPNAILPELIAALYGPDMGLLLYNSPELGMESGIRWQAETDGRYYVSVEGRGGATGTYDLTVKGDIDVSNEWEPPPNEDSARPKTHAFITGVEFQVSESWPMQVIVEVSGEHPSPCHDLEWEMEIQESTYHLTVWKIGIPAGYACATVMQPFTESILLGDDFVSGEITVIINGESYSLTL